jgi:Fe-S-cluster containining protein
MPIGNLYRLKGLYALYDGFCSQFRRFCRKGCSLCCTANVTLTGLEAKLILANWQAQGRTPPLSVLSAAAGRPRFRPAITINALAELCARGMDGPDEAADPEAGPCPLLENHLCSIYDVRPFGCRAMQSLSDCGREGTADMPEWVFSANTLFLQYIEAADSPGITGNLTDVLLSILTGAENTASVQQGMPSNRSIPVLMIPPEHRDRLKALVRSLQQVLLETDP